MPPVEVIASKSRSHREYSPDFVAEQGHVVSDGLADVAGTDDCNDSHWMCFVLAGL